MKYNGLFTADDMCGTYCDLGEHTFKLVLNSNKFKNSHGVRVEMRDPDGKPIQTKLSCWGRKLYCTFNLVENLPMGVCLVKVYLKDVNNEEYIETLHYWFIK